MPSEADYQEILAALKAAKAYLEQAREVVRAQGVYAALEPLDEALQELWDCIEDFGGKP